MATVNALSVALFNAAAGGYSTDMSKNPAAYAAAVGAVLEQDLSSDAAFVAHLLSNFGVATTDAVYADAQAALTGMVAGLGRANATTGAIDFLAAQTSSSAYYSIATAFAAKVATAAAFSAANASEFDVSELIGAVTGVDTDAVAIAAAYESGADSRDTEVADLEVEVAALEEELAAVEAAAAAAAVTAAAELAAAEEAAAAAAVTAAAELAAAEEAAAAAAVTAAAELAAAEEAAAAAAVTAAAELAAAEEAAAAAAVTAAATAAALQAEIDALENPDGGSFVLTTGTDVFIGVDGGDDTFTATEANFEGDSDILVDGNSTDDDTLNVTGTAFSAAITSAGNTIAGIENVNVAFDSLVQSTFTASGVIGGATITVSQSRSGGSDDVIVATAGDGSTVVAGSGVNTLTVSTMTAGYDLTVDGGSATGTITADLTTDGILSVTADTATGVNVSTATGTATVVAAAATTIDVETTSGDISITTDVDSNIDADSTIAGDIVIAAAASEDVVANTTGAGTVTVTAEGNAITTVAKTATINVVESDTTATDMSVTGTGTADSVTINLGDDATVTNAAANAVETITVNATAAAVVTVDTTAATTYVGDANTTFAGNEAMFDGKTVTGAAEVQITTLDTSDLTDIATATNINVAADAASKTLTVSSGAIIEISDVIDTALTLKYSDGATANDDAGVLNVTLNKASITGALALDVTADTVATLNLAVATAPGAFVLTAGSTDVVATGSKALALTNTSTFGSLDASAMTAAVTVSAITSGDVITTGSAADTVTLVSTATTADVSTGAGNDAISTSAAYAGALDSGAGTDTLTVGGAVDLSGATISNVERLEIGANNISVDESFFDSQSIVVGGTGTITVKNVTASLDLSLLTFSSTAATSVDFTSSRDAALGASADFSVVGSANIDTIVTGNGSNDVSAGAGNDIVTGGTGVDTILGGAGNDTVDGGAGADAIYGEAGDDSLKGGAGADTLDGGAGADTLLAGTGADSTPEARSTVVSGTVAATDTFALTAFGKTVTFTAATTTIVSVIDGLATAIAADGVLGKLLSVAKSDTGATGSNNTLTVTSLVDGNFTDFSFAVARVGGGSSIASSTITAVDGTASTNLDTLNGGDGTDFVHTAGGIDTVDLGSADGDVDTVAILTLSEGADVISNFTSGEDVITFAGDLLNNSTDTDTLVSIAADGATVDNRVFFEITDATAAAGADTAAEIVTFLADLTLTSIASGDDVVFAVNDGSDTYLWQFTEDGTAGIGAANLTLVAKLVGITDIATGDLAQIA